MPATQDSRMSPKQHILDHSEEVTVPTRWTDLYCIPFHVMRVCSKVKELQDLQEEGSRRCTPVCVCVCVLCVGCRPQSPSSCSSRCIYGSKLAHRSVPKLQLQPCLQEREREPRLVHEIQQKADRTKPFQ